MSGQQNQTTPSRAKSSPIGGKGGPLKATIPMASLLKQNSNLRAGRSPTSSPTSFWKSRISPDHSSGQRSPGSCIFKVKARTSTNSPDGGIIRRTVSLDTIYLKGHWPRDNFYWQSGTLQIDKATQTENNDWLDCKIINSITEGKEDSLENIRPRIRNLNESNKFVDQTLDTSSQTATFLTSQIHKASPVTIPQPLRPISKFSIRSSIEGLNQEIEGLVLKTQSAFTCDRNEYDKFRLTPEGHRAPLAELFRATRSRSVNTQTPGEGDPTGSCDLSGGSQGSSPDQEANRLGTSPHINRFLAREPPDGCERVSLKSYNERLSMQMDTVPQPSTFKLKPSLGSAFQCLKPGYNFSTDRDSPIVPPSQNM